ncbi:MAG: RagB/SusD family nutrient uptake outer membrane protein [Chryseotalea sp.]
MKIKYFILVTACLVSLSCDKEILDIRNPNKLEIKDLDAQGVFLSWAQGAVYQTGFNGITDPKYGGRLGDSFWFLGQTYHELMGDVVGASAANNIINQIGVPDEVTYSDATKSINTAPVKQVLKINNDRSKASQNPFYYEWTWMYFMNNACNGLLVNVDNVKFIGDKPSRVNTIKAWAYFWKGYAYSRIGSLYLAGIISDEFNKTNGNYVSRQDIIAEAERNFNLAEDALDAITSDEDYETVLGILIPDFCQVGKGGVLTPAEWKKTMNTLRARNVLVNKRLTEMTAADWNQILTLTSGGITENDLIFTGRAPSVNGFFTANNGSVAAKAATASQTLWPTERLFQEFDQVNDQRFLNNFTLRTSPKVDAGGTIIYGARYFMEPDGKGLDGVIVYSSRTAGEYELVLAGNYEENALMRAEALINTNSVEAGLQIIDNVRDYQGAGLANVAGTGLTLSQAREVLRRERRIALAFKGLSFYDARRLGWLDGNSGRSGAVVLRNATTLDTNSTIKYNFLSYWDVPNDEIALNPNTGSVPTSNE